MKNTRHSAGYYRLSIAVGNGRLLASNSERAFVVSQLQDLLSPRYLLGDIPAHRQLASCIDLLAFSITTKTIELVTYSIDKGALHHFAQQVINRLVAYQYDLSTHPSVHTPTLTTKKLRGPHHALAQTVILHHLHVDWEYDRYSSIGFYLHDRRGDWMRMWRMAKLYENNPLYYRRLMLNDPFTDLDATTQPLQSFAS